LQRRYLKLDVAQLEQLLVEAARLRFVKLIQIFSVRDGWIEIPDKPGFGVELDERIAARYEVGIEG
jgi:L-alanine-DL-glutamate epimerase-like enolase superfamily enzyme